MSSKYWMECGPPMGARGSRSGVPSSETKKDSRNFGMSSKYWMGTRVGGRRPPGSMPRSYHLRYLPVQRIASPRFPFPTGKAPRSPAWGVRGASPASVLPSSCVCACTRVNRHTKHTHTNQPTRQNPNRKRPARRTANTTGRESSRMLNNAVM